jgi:hypothetical protein
VTDVITISNNIILAKLTIGGAKTFCFRFYCKTKITIAIGVIEQIQSAIKACQIEINASRVGNTIAHERSS